MRPLLLVLAAFAALLLADVVGGPGRSVGLAVCFTAAIAALIWALAAPSSRCSRDDEQDHGLSRRMDAQR